MRFIDSPNTWHNFLIEKADKFELNERQNKVFLVRFACNNLARKDNEIIELLLGQPEYITRDTYPQIKGRIYEKFATLPLGYPELKEKSNKYKALLEWLRYKYSEWIDSYAPTYACPYYIERPIESECCSELRQPNGFVRIKASQKMGKTSFLKEVLRELNRKGNKALRFDFALEESEIFDNYERFCRSFGAGITEALDLPDRLTDCWDNCLGSNRNLTKYFKRYLLPELDRPLILGLDGLDRVFEHPTIATDFCGLLRGWYDKRHQAIWQKLRLAVVHSTDVYVGLNINNSPLTGIGKIFTLESFSVEQVKTLAQRYELSLKSNTINELMIMFGGHPYLIDRAFRYMANPRNNVSWSGFLKSAPTDGSIFGNHLRQHLKTLQQNPALAAALIETITATESIILNTQEGFILVRLGLVKIMGNAYTPMCDLYRLYFQARLDELR